MSSKASKTYDSRPDGQSQASSTTKVSQECYQQRDGIPDLIFFFKNSELVLPCGRGKHLNKVSSLPETEDATKWSVLYSFYLYLLCVAFVSFSELSRRPD